MQISLSPMSLVVLIGAASSGKSTFARTHFDTAEIVNCDSSGGSQQQTAATDAPESTEAVIERRLARGQLTVIDGTNLVSESRRVFARLAKQFHVTPVAIVFSLPEAVCLGRHRARSDRRGSVKLVRAQVPQATAALRNVTQEGFQQVVAFRLPEDVDGATIERVPLAIDRRAERGPFDVIGDVHGCADELETLLDRLGYVVSDSHESGPLGGPVYRHPQKRRVVFVGDLVDRGPRVLDVVRIAAGMCAAGAALVAPGNHDAKFIRALQGKTVRIGWGLAESLAEVRDLPGDEAHRQSFVNGAIRFLESLPGYLWLDEGRLVVAHAGLQAEHIGRFSSEIRAFALYGAASGETDDEGIAVRGNWAADYKGESLVVYGHTPVAEPWWQNESVNIDTGCVFGGALTALRYPEREIVRVAAKKVYWTPERPFGNA